MVTTRSSGVQVRSRRNRRLSEVFQVDGNPASQRKRRNAVATSKKENSAGKKRRCSEKRQQHPEDTLDDQLCQEDHGHPEKKRTKISEEAPENSTHVGHLSRDSPAQGDDPLWWNPRDEDIVREVKTCLHVGSAETHCIPSCREKQVECITEWLDDCTSRHAGGAIYLSGVPGTGKTLAATSIVRQAVEKLNQTDCAPPVALSINCMRSKTAKDVLVRIIDAFKTAALKTVTGQLGEDPVVQVPDDNDKAVVLSGPWADLSPQEHLKNIIHSPVVTKHEIGKIYGKRRRSSISEVDLVKQTGMILLILDEIDGMLEGKDCEEIVGSLISLASAKESRLVIIGIANSIDLMQQFMRPGAILHRFNLKPKNVVFPTYLRDQVSQLIRERLERLPGPVFDNRAIEFCARKIANGTGDMRRALSAASLAVDFATKEFNNRSVDGEDQTTSPKPLVGMSHMARALSKVSGGIGASNEHVNSIRTLPVPQQLIMCVVGAMIGENLKARGLKSSEKRESQLMGMKLNHNVVSLPTYTSIGRVDTSKAKSIVTLTEIESNHRTLCSKSGVEQYSHSEFVTAMEVLSTLGLIQLSNGHGNSGMARTRVQLKVSEDDVWMALSSIPILKDILIKA
ncbi:hypothetical protein M9435_002168 [Picochlorum sp. BPE23]|nr:hypothetical protein M9435_002168 [Picochlorum sp. BPE23]